MSDLFPDAPFVAKPHMFSDAASAMKFMMAGNATITIRSTATGARFTYKLSVAKDDGRPQPNGAPTFVALMNGPDNESSFQYLGTIFPQSGFTHGRKSRITPDAPSAVAFSWAFGHLSRGRMPSKLEVWHEARCGRCGKKLTVPESIESGFGPECITMVGG
jgi:hypothetical protein